jgi:hypothetical protein
MMTQQLGVSILSAPLAAIDRRALSQAWYSALHLARDSSRPHTRSHEGNAQNEEERAADAREGTARRRNRALLALVPHAPRTRMSLSAAAEGDRRARSSLGRKIEKMVAHPLRVQRRATFTIDGTSARVHVILRTSGDLVHVVAICSPALRVRVSRALSEACVALSSRGIALGFETKEAANDR